MTMNRTSGVPRVPTLPKGEQVAAYDTYLEAQHAVDHLSDKAFPVQHVTIVGTDLRMVERVTGRLTYSRVALAGLASGAWFGLFVGLLLSLFATTDAAALPILPAVAIGAAFGILFSVISYAFAGGRRDFTSSSQIVASTYALLCGSEHAHKARALLAEAGGPGLGRAAVPAVPAQPARPATAAELPQPPEPGVPAQPGDRTEPGHRTGPPAPPADPGV
ncbi:general stress protein [Cellulomonas sp. KRMCY2]|uniref:general stress protein n=1 Tax=Cellulomonas sp. KRMCY2 TaxID=1304865 RepID=UPI00045EAAA9|nr:general stress protein [Cellulomonas sp. KRMCY2]